MSYQLQDVKGVISKLCSIIIKNEVYFCELDSAAGDGDFGMSLSKGFKEIERHAAELNQEESIDRYLLVCSGIITEYCGGASGPIWGSAFRSAAKVSRGKEELTVNDLVDILWAVVEGIQRLGGAKRGDKTLLDALIPAVEGLEQACEVGLDGTDAFRKAVKGAVEGAEATKSMTAARGRASYLGERSLNYPDAGAMAVSIILKEFLDN